MSAHEQATQCVAAVVNGPDPSPPGPGPDPEQDDGLDLQAIRLAGVTATPIVERMLAIEVGEEWDDAHLLDQVLDGLTKTLEEVERLRHEVATREAAARHALDAATTARERAALLEIELEQAEGERAAAWMVEAQCWDLLGQARDYIAEGSDGLSYDTRQLVHGIARYMEADPPAVGRALWARLRTAEAVAEVAEHVPDLLGEGSFSANAIDQTRAHLLAALAAWKAARAGEVQ
jgi:hypothetical protein